MGVKLSHTRNAQIISSRIGQGDLDQYFKSFSREDIKQVSEAINKDDADDVSEVLIRNLNMQGTDLEDFLEDIYDSQYIDLGKRFVEDYLKEQIIRTKEAINNFDINELGNILEDLDFNFPQGFKLNVKNIKNQIKEVIDSLNVPDKLKELTKDLAKEKKIKMTPEFYSRVIKWKDGRIVLEIRRVSDNRWKTFKILKKAKISELKTKKSDLPKFQFKEPKRLEVKKNIKEFRKDMRGKPLNFREKIFIDSRLENDFEEIYLDYLDDFGDIRNKTELRNLVNKRR